MQAPVPSYVRNITKGQAAANKAVVLDANSKINTLDITMPKIGGLALTATGQQINSLPNQQYFHHLFRQFELPAPKSPASLIGHWDFTGLNANATTVVNKASATTGRNNLLETYGCASANKTGFSEPRIKDVYASSGGAANITLNLSGLLGYTFTAVPAIHIPSSAEVRQYVNIPATSVTLSIYVVMDSAGVPVINSDIVFAYNGVARAATITAVPSVMNCYRLTFAVNGSGADATWQMYAPGAKSFSVTLWMINAGGSALPYEQTPYGDLTLVGSPTIAANGVTFNGTNQCAVTNPFCILNGNWTVLAVITNNNTDGSTRILFSVGEISGANHRIDVQTVGINASLNADGYQDANGHTVGSSSPMLYALESTASGVKLNNYVLATNGAAAWDTSRGRLCIAARAIDEGVNSGETSHEVMFCNAILSRTEMRQAFALMYYNLLSKWIDIGVSVPPLITALPANNCNKPNTPYFCSWGLFGTAPNTTGLKGVVDAMVASGLKGAGWNMIEIDAFAYTTRDAANQLVANPTNFPNGISEVLTYITANGMTYGFYTSVGNQAASVNGLGCFGFDWEDAHFAISHGAVFVELDAVTWPYGYTKQWSIWPEDIQAEYFSRMGTALLAQSQDVFFNICGWSDNHMSDAAEKLAKQAGCNGFRFSGDTGLTDAWSVAEAILFAPLTPETNGTAHTIRAQFAKPGFYYDPALLHVGSTIFSATEIRTEFTQACLLAFQLQISYDVAAAWNNGSPVTKDATNFATLTNTEAMAINQDSLSLMALQVQKAANSGADSYAEVWAKPLSNGKWAVGLFNRGASAHSITITWATIQTAIRAYRKANPTVGYPDYTLTGSQPIRDIWNVSNPANASSYTATNLASHACALIVVG